MESFFYVVLCIVGKFRYINYNNIDNLIFILLKV